MRRLVAPAWLARHAVAVVLVAACLALGWWQVGRAASGNTLSWAYAVQWPIFAGFVAFIWVREVRRALAGDATDQTGTAHAGMAPASGATAGQPGAVRRPVLTMRPAPVQDDRDDPELAAYNHYLAWLNANPGARPADYRRRSRQPPPGERSRSRSLAEASTPPAVQCERSRSRSLAEASTPSTPPGEDRRRGQQTTEEETWAQPFPGTA